MSARQDEERIGVIPERAPDSGLGELGDVVALSVEVSCSCEGQGAGRSSR